MVVSVLVALFVVVVLVIFVRPPSLTVAVAILVDSG